MKNFIRTFALLAGATALGLTGLHAADLFSEDFSIPFAFRVQNVTLPAGTYRVERTIASEVAMLVNLENGHHIKMIGFSALRGDEPKVKLVFEKTADGQVLKQIR